MSKRYNFSLNGEIKGVDNTPFMDFSVNWRELKYSDVVGIEAVLSKAMTGTVQLGVAAAEVRGDTQAMQFVKKVLGVT